MWEVQIASVDWHAHTPDTSRSIVSMIDLPREVCLAAVFQMISFLKIKHNGVTVFDSTEPEIDQTQFSTEDWSENLMVSVKRKLLLILLHPET